METLNQVINSSLNLLFTKITISPFSFTIIQYLYSLFALFIIAISINKIFGK